MQSIMTSLSTHLDHLDWMDTESRPPQVREHGLQPDHSNSADIKRILCVFYKFKIYNLYVRLLTVHS